jgi:hypothetical protein
MMGLCISAWVVGGCAGPRGGFSPRPGDLLFEDLNGGPLCDAIEDVTIGYRGARLSHVGLAAKDEAGRIIVLEAVSKGVVATDLRAFLDRATDPNGRPRVIVGRLKAPYRRLIPAAIEEAGALKGKPYDRVFAIGNDVYYCSELVYEVFRKANGGRALFPLEPMTFKDPRTRQTQPAWEQYFEKLGVKIPEGEPGINPGGISRSPVLTIVHSYARPDDK